MTTLVVTNDFPPRIGGIESFVALACRLLDDDVAVLTSTAPGSAYGDVAAGYPIERLPGPLLPSPAVGRAAVDLLQRSGADRVLFGAAAPLALLAPTLRAAGADRIVALTHGHETWWATLPGSRGLLRRIGDEVDVLTTISDYVTERIASALSPAGRAKLVRLPPPVDLDVFRPEPSPTTSGAGTATDVDSGTKRVVGVGRLVRRKGFDTLLDAWDLLGQTSSTSSTTAARPELVLVGDGPERGSLERQVRRAGLRGVTFTGALDPTGVLAQLRRADVFALPVRTRLAGLDPEGLGLAALEAGACGVPVVVGRSGGAPETVRQGRTGYVVDPDDPYELALRLADLLTDPEHARELGTAGRAFVGERYGAEQRVAYSVLLWGCPASLLCEIEMRARDARCGRGSRVADQTKDSIEIAASPAEVMAVIADVASYPEWVSAMKQVDIVSTHPDGKPDHVKIKLEHSVVSDHYTLAYHWLADSVSWHLVEGQLLKAMDGSYELTPSGQGTKVTYALSVDVRMPMIGMFRRKAEKTIIDGALKDLKQRVEG